MEEGSEAGYRRILNSYKNKGQKTLLITKGDFCYTALILELYEDSVLFSDKFGNQILLNFSEIKQIGGSGR